MKRILSGIQPTGKPHIGNYFGMMRPCIELQDEGEAFIFIADYHALTQHPQPEELQNNVMGVALDFLACGLDPKKATFFRQTDVPEVTELTWILNCFTPVGLLERCTSYKDKVARGISANNGLFSYPVLMACDILIYKSDVVPVGRDQKQHLEVTRDVAIKFNNRYGEIFVLPEEQIRDTVAVVPGTDGQKMSKSYGNTIELFGPKKATRKRFMSIVSDSTPLEDPKDPDNCNTMALYKLFADDDEVAELEAKYRAGNFGYGHAKQALFEKYWEWFEPMRETRAELERDLDYVEDVLCEGARKARKIASATMAQVRDAVGLSQRPTR